jgi:hypothetical protein
MVMMVTGVKTVMGMRMGMEMIMVRGRVLRTGGPI